MKYDCELVKDLLPLYHDKATSKASSQVVEDHLNECDECLRYYQEIKKTDEIQFKSSAKTENADDYLSLAKRLRKTKWYWRICIGIFLGCIIYLSLMYGEGNRFDAVRAAYTSNVIDKYSQLLATIPMGKERILYIYDDNGLYRYVDVSYHFPFWKYNNTWPNRSLADPDSGVQLIVNRSYANSRKKSLYIVYAVAVNDKRVAYIELGKEGFMQRQKVNSTITIFFWNETGDWDGTNSWKGMIKDSELQGTAYSSDGTVLYNLSLVTNSNVQDSFQWIPVQ